MQHINHITKLPKNLCYMPTGDIKENGKPIMALDITGTHICMVPAKLEGVDRIYARKGQLEYVAPGYKGQIYLFESSLGKNGSEVISVQPLKLKDIAALKFKYNEIIKLTPNFFTQSYTRDRICNTWLPDEMHLPAKLSFFWNSEQQTGTLYARKTWLTGEQPQIINVSNIIMPLTQDIQNKSFIENKYKARAEKKDKRRDYGFIRQMTVCGEITK